MKKITKQDLNGLSKSFPVYGQEDMRKVVGGMNIDEAEAYLNDALGGQGTSYTYANGNTTWTKNDGLTPETAYTQSQFLNWDGGWYGGYVQDGRGGYAYVIGDTVVIAPDFHYREEKAMGNRFTVTVCRGEVARKLARKSSTAAYYEGVLLTAATVAVGSANRPMGGVMTVLSLMRGNDAFRFCEALADAADTGSVKITTTYVSAPYGGYYSTTVYDATGTALYRGSY